MTAELSSYNMDRLILIKALATHEGLSCSDLDDVESVFDENGVSEETKAEYIALRTFWDDIPDIMH